MRALHRRRIQSTAKKIGFGALGNFLIGARTRDIVSGVAIDATPSSTYMWTFLLPAFDDLEFLHMSLGRRMFSLDTEGQPLEQQLIQAWASIAPITDAKGLLSYVVAEGMGGEYAEWVRFICLVRLGNFKRAESLLPRVAQLQSADIPRKLEELDAARSIGGWSAVRAVLNDWSIRNDALLKDAQTEI
jgi:hypothetical protein